MNLGSIVDQICSLARQNDSEAKEECAGFVKRRYEMICKGTLWKDLLQPITCRLPFAVYVNAQVSLKADLENDWKANAQGIYQFPEMVDRLISVRLTDQPVSAVESSHLFTANPDLFNQIGTPANFQIMAGALWTNSGGDACYVWATDTNDLNKTVTVSFTDADNRVWEQAVVLTSISPTLGASLSPRPAIIHNVRKGTTVGNVLIGPTGAVFVLTAYPYTTWMSPRIRIALLPKPDRDTTFYSLIKKHPLPLDHNDKVPELRGVEDTLIAFGCADVLFRARQHTKAREFQAEGIALQKALENECSWQEANTCRLVPNCEPNFMDMMGGSWLSK